MCGRITLTLTYASGFCTEDIAPKGNCVNQAPSPIQARNYMICKHYAVLCYLAGQPVLVKIPRTVGVSLLLLSAQGGCTRPAKDHPAGSAPSTARATAEAAPPPSAPASASSSATAAAPGPSARSSAVPSSSAAPAPSPASATDTPTVAASGSAYVGCGEPIPLTRLWDETTEAEVLDAISSAKTCAAQHNRRLLLEFVAPWCADCQEMSKLDETPLVAAALRSRFERVRVNVGKWDRHEALRENFGVRALATYVVIDPKTSKLLAKTTLEPITRKGKKLTAEQWASWLKTH